MSTFTAEFPHLAHQVSDLDVDQLIAKATKFSTNFQPRIVFISSTDLNKKFGHHLIHPVYCCKSMHDFLKIGLDRHGCVIVVDENRAECSTRHLRELLTSRTTQPFEIIPYSQPNEHQLLNEIKDSCQRVMHLISLERTISHTAQKIVSSNPRASTASGYNHKSSNSVEYKVSQNLIRSRVSEVIDPKPEEFLRDAISQIRKTQKS